MKWSWSQDTIITGGFVVALIFVGISLLVNTGKSCDSTTNFLVLQDANLSEDSLSRMYFDCLKYCGDKFAGSQGSKSECFAQCYKIKDFSTPEIVSEVIDTPYFLDNLTFINTTTLGSVCGNLTYVQVPCDCWKDGCLLDCFRCV